MAHARMSHWLGKCLFLVAALGVLDGHLLLAQSWAWLTMLQDRAPEQSISGAFESTFSGEAPCPMCCAIQKEKQKQEEQTPIPELKPTAKFPPSMFSRSFIPRLGSALHIGLPICEIEKRVHRYEQPPSPPPRRLAHS